MNISDISGETYDHKVAAIFDSESSARQAAKIVCDTTSVPVAQIFVVGPHDKHPGWELEPEDKGIWRTLVRSHIWLAIAGAAAGVILFLILFGLGIPFITQNAITSAALGLGFGAVVGMMFAGLLTLRPDHMSYLSSATSALRKGKYVVVVHAETSDQMREAHDVLDKMKVKTVASL